MLGERKEGSRGCFGWGSEKDSLKRSCQVSPKEVREDKPRENQVSPGYQGVRFNVSYFRLEEMGRINTDLCVKLALSGLPDGSSSPGSVTPSTLL